SSPSISNAVIEVMTLSVDAVGSPNGSLLSKTEVFFDVFFTVKDTVLLFNSGRFKKVSYAVAICWFKDCPFPICIENKNKNKALATFFKRVGLKIIKLCLLMQIYYNLQIE